MAFDVSNLPSASSAVYATAEDVKALREDVHSLALAYNGTRSDVRTLAQGIADLCEVANDLNDRLTETNLTLIRVEARQRGHHKQILIHTVVLIALILALIAVAT